MAAISLGLAPAADDGAADDHRAEKQDFPMRD
jgi:hypothetical protein